MWERGDKALSTRRRLNALLSMPQTSLLVDPEVLSFVKVSLSPCLHRLNNSVNYLGCPSALESGTPPRLQHAFRPQDLAIYPTSQAGTVIYCVL